MIAVPSRAGNTRIAQQIPAVLSAHELAKQLASAPTLD